ncbi:hypothetical protein JW926_11955 [Candidatus Sumerlaeota bacterium]|nr:hypothetical protein [Candidatus Sumerlaeota bacterium]
MKKYTTDHMSSKDRQNLSGNLLSSMGNDNIRGNHIYYFENKISEYKENKNKNLSSSPNYYAWLCLMSEHIFWRMKSFCFKQSDLKEDNLNLVYNELITEFCEICRNLDIYSKEDIHDKFTQDYMIEVIAWYSNPKNFIEAKSEFDFLISIMNKGLGISVIF